MRPETAIAHYEDGGHGATTAVPMITAMARLPETGPPSAGLALVIRFASVFDRSAKMMANPVFGLLYGVKLEDGMRVAFFLGKTFPLGASASTNADVRTKGANARAQYDNSIFAANDIAIVPGVSAAWSKHGATIQGEATFIYTKRMLAEVATEPEASKSTLTCGLHIGVFATSFLSIGGELRYQRWLSAPFAVEKDRSRETRDNTSIAIGPRFHVPLGDHVWVRPGVAYQRYLDAPLDDRGYHIVQLDVPIVFM